MNPEEIFANAAFGGLQDEGVEHTAAYWSEADGLLPMLFWATGHTENDALEAAVEVAEEHWRTNIPDPEDLEYQLEAANGRVWAGRRGPFLNTEYGYIDEKEIPTSGKGPKLAMRLGPVDPRYEYWSLKSAAEKLGDVLSHFPNPEFQWYIPSEGEAALRVPGFYFPDEEGVEEGADRVLFRWTATEEELERPLSEEETTALESMVMERATRFRPKRGPKDWRPRRKPE
jgi:hypothetical protein